MILNAHTWYSLRYGVISPAALVRYCLDNGYDTVALTDINNSTGVLEFVSECNAAGLKPIAGMEFRRGDDLLYIALARNPEGFREINELMTARNLNGVELPARPCFNQCYVVYPFCNPPGFQLRDNEFIGVRPGEANRLATAKPGLLKRCVICQPVTYTHYAGYETHKKLRAVDHNLLLSQLKPGHTGGTDEYLRPQAELIALFDPYPPILENTRMISRDCSFGFDFKSVKNRKTFTGSHNDDRELLRKLAFDGMEYRYGKTNATARKRIETELEIIRNMGFSAYFLIAADIIRYSMQRGYYHVGRGSGANSIVAYCLRITDVCPVELDLYFERFLNPKRKSPPDFDIDYSWKERDDVIEYIFKRYGTGYTALLGAMSTFRDRSIIREMGKVYGMPKADIDRMISDPGSPLNQNGLCREILDHYNAIEDFPNMRSIHAGGILISEEPLTCYTALDLPPKGFPTTQFDMYLAEEIGFEKLDILSQRGIGHIRDAADIILDNRGVKVDIHQVQKFKSDPRVKAQLKSGDTIGCFYIESPAMRGLLKKLRCDTYTTLVAASSIIRPGVARSGMMKQYVNRFHNPGSFSYLHPILGEQLSETYGVMVYQEDVLKVGHHFGGLDLADADVLRRMMSGKMRNKKLLAEIENKYFNHCQAMGYPEVVSREVWRQIESFAGYSFSKAHSASYAVESFQSLYLKAHFPLEFMVAVINNFGGYYQTRVYVNEARMCGGNICLPCVNKSMYSTTLHNRDVYLGFVHIASLNRSDAHLLISARESGGLYTDLEDFIRRSGVGMETLRLLIRLGALRFTGKNKRQLLWESFMIFDKDQPAGDHPLIFHTPAPAWQLPGLSYDPVEDAYDEMELLGFPVSINTFALLKTSYRGECHAGDLMIHTGKTVRILGEYVTCKRIRTIKGETMAFGTFLDAEGHFFDTTHFPPSLRAYPFSGSGVYLISGKVVEDFGFPGIEVDKMARLPIHPDPRAG